MHGTNPTLIAAIEWFCELLEEQPIADIVDWCRDHLYVQDPARGGMRHWIPELYPHQIPILRAWVDPDIREVVFVGASQTVGKTSVGLGCVLWSCEAEKLSAMIMHPTLEVGEGFSRSKLQPAIDADTKLTQHFAPQRARAGANTLLRKEFAGGALTIRGSNSAAGLRGSTASRLWADDAAACLAASEGDSLDLFRKRAAGVEGGTGKILITSSPGGIETCNTWPRFEAGTAREMHVKCPHCMATVTLEGTVSEPLRCVKWPEGQPELATLICPACQHPISESERLACYLEGEMQATNPHPEPHVESFRLSAIWTPWTAAGTRGAAHAIAAQWEAANTAEKRQVVVNTVLALPFSEQNTALTLEKLREGCENADWRETRPPAVEFITAGIDVQEDRLEVAIVGHSKRGEMWLVDYVSLMGLPRLPAHLTRADSGVWAELDAILEKHGPACALIDHGGHHAREVALYTYHRAAMGVWASKGRGEDGAPLARWGKTKATGNARPVRLVLVGTVAAKDTIAAALAKNELHLPRWVDELWLRQLCAEVPVIRISRGRKVRAWELRPGQRRNEALDTLVYALAAAAVAGDRGRTGKEWRGLPRRDVAGQTAAPVPQEEKPAPQMKRGPMRTGWL